MILVTGSSGTVGKELLRQLVREGSKVRAAYRSRPPSVPGRRISIAYGWDRCESPGTAGPFDHPSRTRALSKPGGPAAVL